ncbi:MAG: TolC family protein [Gammaproteobacteria bacterium]|nr:TolC family protein [Gammaproteobacteria bacterium]
MPREIAALLLVMVFTLPAATEADRRLPEVQVAIVSDGTSERVTALRAQFLKEMRAVNSGEFDIQAPTDLQIEANRTLKGVRAALDRVLSDPRTDLVVTLGVLGSHAAATRANLPKPVVAPLVSSHELQELPYKDGASGKRNLSYVSLDVDISRDLLAFREIVPFNRLAFLFDGSITQAIPGIRNEVNRVARELGVTITKVAVADSTATSLAAIPQDSQAVYVGPLPALSTDEYQQLVAGLIERRLPSFAFEGKSDVERGLLVGIAPAVQMDRLARRVALNARRILLGEKAATLPVAFARAEGLTLNMRTARAIGFSPSWQLLTRAELLHEEPEAAGAPLTLGAAVREALELNLDLRVAQSSVAAGKENIREARSALLPRIGLSGNMIDIEEDDAAAVPGRAERTTSGSLTLDQSLYSETAWANLEVQKQLQAARVGEYEQVRLDIVLDTAQAYLDLLRARTNTRVQKDNLRLSRSNLELARARRRIGTAGPSEVYRWESEIANAHRAVVEAQAQTQVAEITLNALLHRPLEDTIVTAEVGLDEPVLVTSQQHLYELIDNPASFRIFRDFIVQDAFAAVPELRQLDARIRAQERRLKSARNAYWQPELSLRADRTETLDRSGTQGTPLPGLDDSETTVALQLSLPLFTGGARGAQKSRAYEELTGLRVQRHATAELIEQRVRATLHTTRSAYTAIRLSRQAADAAESNFVVVRDAYSRGTVSILDLLDAQNAALVADLRAATAVYDFVRALMEVQRAAAHFDFFLTPGDQADWFKRADRYFAEHGAPLPQD